MSILDNKAVRDFLGQGWIESCPETGEAHEEGGFILRNPAGAFLFERWPRGQQNEIFVPSHEGGFRNGLLIVATFHTHPNPGPDYEQEPSLTDIRAVRNDPDLNHPEYEGEYVISSKSVYLVKPDGDVQRVGVIGSLLLSSE